MVIKARQITKDKLKKKCLEILNKYDLGETLSAEDFIFVKHIFENHLNSNEKN
jgi:hypothetical protein